MWACAMIWFAGFPQSMRKSTILPVLSHVPQRKVCLFRMICLSDALPRRHLPFQLTKLLDDYLSRECEKEQMPQMRWAYQIFGNFQGAACFLMVGAASFSGEHPHYKREIWKYCRCSNENPFRKNGRSADCGRVWVLHEIVSNLFWMAEQWQERRFLRVVQEGRTGVWRSPGDLL